jgi:hypothetical protein
MMPLMLGVLSIMVSGVLVAWRRIDANFSPHPYHHPYETQSYGAYKTLVLYVYHESDEVTKDNLLFFLKVRSVVGWGDRRGGTG